MLSANDQTELLHESKPAAVFNRAFKKFYILCYYVGIYTVLALKTVVNSSKFFAGRIKRLFGLVLSKFQNIKATEFKLIINGYKAICHQSVKAYKSGGLICAVKTHFKLLSAAVKRNKKTKD